MPVRKGRGRINKLLSIKRPGRIDQMTSTDLHVSCRGQPGANEVSFVGKQEESAALGSDVDAGPVLRRGCSCSSVPANRCGRWRGRETRVICRSKQSIADGHSR